MHSIVYRLDNINTAAVALWQMGKDFSVWTFNGEMGAGKTTLISTICQYLGVEDAISSPTYALINEYKFTLEGNPKTIYHADWYRLKDAIDARNAGIDETLYQHHTYSFVEWSSVAPELLSKPYLKIDIELVNENERVLSCSIAN
jgi:tRNA threonylcarbamoyladenosine biosynthesis protein TsaE